MAHVDSLHRAAAESQVRQLSSWTSRHLRLMVNPALCHDRHAEINSVCVFICIGVPLNESL